MYIILRPFSGVSIGLRMRFYISLMKTIVVLVTLIAICGLISTEIINGSCNLSMSPDSGKTE